MKRRRVATALAVAAAAVGASKLWRRRAKASADRVDLYYEDGSMMSLTDGSDDAGRLLAAARRLLADARG
jgi:hypothetical protein